MGWGSDLDAPFAGHFSAQFIPTICGVSVRIRLYPFHNHPSSKPTSSVLLDSLAGSDKLLAKGLLGSLGSVSTGDAGGGSGGTGCAEHD